MTYIKNEQDGTTVKSDQAIPNRLDQAIRGWIVVACGALFYMYQFIIRVSPNIMKDELMAHLSIDATVFGGIVGLYYWSYAGMQIPFGIMMDRLGPRFFMCGASLLCAFASFMFGNATDTFVAGMARFLMGLGSACGLVGTIKLGTIWLEPKHVAKVTGLTMLFGPIGSGLGGAPLKVILLNIGIEYTMELISIIGVVIAVIIFFLVSNKPKLDHHDELPDIYANEHPFTDILKIIKTPQTWFVATYGMLMYIPITTMGIAWGVSFVERAANTTETIAASVISSMFLGAALGSPMFALVSDFLKSRRLPMLIGTILTSSVWFAIFLVQGLPLTLLYVLFFIAGFAYTAKCLTFASICEIMPLNISGVSLAFINTVVMTTGIIFHPLIGALIDYHWNGEMTASGVPSYTEGDFRFALLIIHVCLLASAVSLWFMKETHPESKKADHKIPKEYGGVIDTDVL
jgi:sugar phosphate permease